MRSDDYKFIEYWTDEFKKYETELKEINKSTNCEELKSSRKNEEIKLFPYQKIVGDYINDKNANRGLLVYHKLGSGKTFSAVNVCENTDRKVIIMCPKKLMSDWVMHILMISGKKYGLSPENLRSMKFKKVKEVISEKYRLLSLNAGNVADKLEELSEKWGGLNNKLIVVDEVHNLGRSISSSKDKRTQGMRIFDMIMNAEKLKLLFLSATPSVTHPYELAILFTMLRGYMRIPGDNKRYTLFPAEFDKFMEYFVDKNAMTIKNKNIFQERIIGLVSYYKGISDPEKIIFPERLPPNLIHIEMSGYQWGIYAKYRRKELDEEKKIAHLKKEFVKQFFAKPSRQIGSSYRQKTRQASDFVLPPKDKTGEEIKYPKGKILEDEWNKIIKSINPADFNEKNIKSYSPKIYHILQEIKKTEGILVIYSNFVIFGVGILSRILQENGYFYFDGKTSATDFIKNADKKNNVFSIISGEITDENNINNIKDLLNHKANKDGEFLKVLLITSAISEGATFRNVRKVIIEDPYWKQYKEEQVIGRAVRICSHFLLPPEKRKVEIQYLLAVAPKDINTVEVLGEKGTTDIHLFDLAREDQQLIDSFLEAIKEVAVDCQTLKDFNTDVKKCGKCENKVDKIYYPDLEEHISIRKGNKKGCIPHQTDTLIGPIEHNNYLYVYDAFSYDLFIILNINFIGKIAKFGEIDTSQNSPEEPENIFDLKGVANTTKFKFVLYHPKTKNAYQITKVKYAGEYDINNNNIIINDDFDISEKELKLYK